MERSFRDWFTHGVVGGLLASLVVAAWFLVADLAAGQVFRTPAELGSLLFPEVAGVGARVFLYSLVHLSVFAALGVAAAAFLAASGIRSGWLAGVLFGIGVLNAVHYGALLVAGAPVVAVLPWPHVIGANLAAGLLLMGYLYNASGDGRPVGLAALASHPVVGDGLLCGLAGAAAVALWFFLLDLAAGEPFRTPAALGSALLLGAESPDAVRVTPGVVAAYTAVHAAVFALAGLVFVAVARQVERTPALAYVVLLGAIVLEAASLGAMVAVGGWVLGAVSLWAVGVGNLLAIAAMGGWIWLTRPVLRERVRQEGFTAPA